MPGRLSRARRQQPVAYLAHCPAATRKPCRVMRRCPCTGMGVGDGKRQSDRAQQWDVRRIVTNERALRGRHTQLCRQGAEIAYFVGTSLDHVPDAEFPAAARHGRRAAPGNDGDNDAGVRQRLQAVAVLDVETLQLLAARAVIHTPVGQHSIHVQDQQANGGRGGFATRQDGLLHHACAQQVVGIEGPEQASVLDHRQHCDAMLIHKLYAYGGELARADGAAFRGHDVLHG